MLLQATQVAQGVAEHIVSKPSIINSIESGNSTQIMQTALLAIVTGLAGFFLRSLIVKPHEKLEVFEQARVQILKDELRDFKAEQNVQLKDWQKWREKQEERVVTLELKTMLMHEQITDKIKSLTASVEDTKLISQEIREVLAVVKSQVEKWTH